MDWPAVHKGFPWGILLLVGGGFALAAGTKASGLSTWMGDQLGFLYGIPDWSVCLVLTIMCSLMTECTSNATITSLLIPIIAELVSFFSNFVQQANLIIFIGTGVENTSTLSSCAIGNIFIVGIYASRCYASKCYSLFLWTT